MVIQRTFVSTSGNDSNPGTREAPCRTVQAALALTAPGGEVVALDSGDYAAFVIDKAVTVAAVPEAYAAITVSSGDGVYVRAGGQDAVVLRNLVLTGVGGRHGIFFETGGSLDLEFITGTRADRNRDNGFWFLGGVRGTVRDAAATDNTNSGFFFQPLGGRLSLHERHRPGAACGVSRGRRRSLGGRGAARRGRPRPPRTRWSPPSARSATPTTTPSLNCSSTPSRPS